MMTIPTIFIDTSILSRLSLRNPSVQKLLVYAKKGDIQIALSKVVLDEWRTERVDQLAAAVDKARRITEKEWPLNLFSGRVLSPTQRGGYPERAEIEQASIEFFDEFVTANKVIILDVTLQNYEAARNKYHRWERPFKSASQYQTREQRRIDLPDAWIFEAANDLKLAGQRVTCICNDGNLCAALEEVGIKVVRSIDDLIADLDKPLTAASNKSDAEASHIAAPTKAVEPEVNLVVAALQQADESNRDLQTTILGYVAWFAPCEKNHLLQLLEKKGFARERSEATARVLSIQGFLQDTGNHYIPKDTNVSDAAKPLVMNDMIELLGGGTDGQ